MKAATALFASLLGLVASWAVADSSCTANSADEGAPRTCSITCDGGKQAVCEEGVGDSQPVCRCADDTEDDDTHEREPQSAARA